MNDADEMGRRIERLAAEPARDLVREYFHHEGPFAANTFETLGDNPQGMASDTTFPRGEGADPLHYGLLCEAWCHCFRQPDAYLPAETPHSLISDSDFTNFLTVGSAAEGGRRTATLLDFDFVYVGATEPWKRDAKNVDLALACVDALCRRGYRGLVVTADGMDGTRGVTTAPWLPWQEFVAALASARFLLAPNGCDASPRVIAEALCLDVPVVVQRHILGGWKYVNAFTGALFDDEHDVVPAVEHCLRRPKSPQAWFRAHQGPYHAGRRLLELVRRLDGSVTEASHLVLAPRLAGCPDPGPRPSR